MFGCVLAVADDFMSLGPPNGGKTFSPITWASTSFARLHMNQLIKQLLTWYLTHDKVHECVQALVCFNEQGTILGSSARCYLSHNSAGWADSVKFKLSGLEPEKKYTKPTHKQSDARVCGSQKRRSEDLHYILLGELNASSRVSRLCTAPCRLWIVY